MTRPRVSVEVAELVRWRDRDSCQRCGTYTADGSLHHRQGRGGADPHRAASLALFCGSGSTGCHGYIHAHPAESYRNGWMVRRLSRNRCEDVPLLTPSGWVLLNTDGTTTSVKEGDYADVLG